MLNHTNGTPRRLLPLDYYQDPKDIKKEYNALLSLHNYWSTLNRTVYKPVVMSDKDRHELQNWINEKNKESDNSNLIESVQRVSQFNTLRKNAIFN